MGDTVRPHRPRGRVPVGYRGRFCLWGKNVGYGDFAQGVKCGERVPVPEHKTRGPHGTPRLFSPLLYQLSYLAEWEREDRK
jgi:hypothetical protein